MKVHITDKVALQKLSLLDVRGYLLTQGWVDSGRYGQVATIFSRRGDAGRDHELLLPIKEDVADFADRMSDIVGSLAVVEGRPEISIFQDLVRSGFDVLRFRAPDADEAGTIGLETGAALYEYARDLLAAVANATIKPKRAYRGNSPERAKEYMRSLRLGQTEIGSYVFAILSPVPPSFEIGQKELFPDLAVSPEPFSREVTLKLNRALRATKGAVAEAGATGRLDAFEAAIESGVSANLCEAISSLADEGDGVDISINWSRVRPSSEPMVEYSFSRDNARVLSQAAIAFKEREPMSDVTIEGIVVSLHREPDEFDGRAKIRGFIGGDAMTLSAQFLLPDYRMVLEAHERKLWVRVDGELVKRGAYHYLEAARNLVVLYDDQRMTSDAIGST